MVVPVSALTSVIHFRLTYFDLQTQRELILWREVLLEKVNSLVAEVVRKSHIIITAVTVTVICIFIVVVNSFATMHYSYLKYSATSLWL